MSDLTPPEIARPDADSARMVQQSIYRLAGRELELTEGFYGHLFAMLPEVRTLFPDDMAEQRVRLLRALLSSINALHDSLHDPSGMEARLQALGEIHYHRGIADDQYQYVGHALIRTVRDVVPAEWSTWLSSAWISVCSWMIQHMVVGAKRARSEAEAGAPGATFQASQARYAGLMAAQTGAIPVIPAPASQAFPQAAQGHPAQVGGQYAEGQYAEGPYAEGTQQYAEWQYGGGHPVHGYGAQEHAGQEYAGQEYAGHGYGGHGYAAAQYPGSAGHPVVAEYPVAQEYPVAAGYPVAAEYPVTAAYPGAAAYQVTDYGAGRSEQHHVAQHLAGNPAPQYPAPQYPAPQYPAADHLVRAVDGSGPVPTPSAAQEFDAALHPSPRHVAVQAGAWAGAQVAASAGASVGAPVAEDAEPAPFAGTWVQYPQLSELGRQPVAALAAPVLTAGLGLVPPQVTEASPVATGGVPLPAVTAVTAGSVTGRVPTGPLPTIGAPAAVLSVGPTSADFGTTEAVATVFPRRRRGAGLV